MQSSRPYFLDLPLELRLYIYDFALADADVLTISTAIVDATVPIASPESSPKSTIPGLPSGHVPLVRCHYDPSLLSISDPPTQPIRAAAFTDSGFFEESDPKEPDSSSASLPHPTSLSLLQTCHQIHDELELHVYRRANAAKRAAAHREHDDATPPRTTHAHGGLSLYVSYPYGILVLKHHYPHLLRQARSVHICGYFVSHKQNAYHYRRSSSGSSAGSTISSSSSQASEPVQSASAPSSATVNHRHDDIPLPRHPLPATETAHEVLGAMVSQILATRPSPLLRLLQMRIFYPDQAAYTHVWGDDFSPIGEGMRNIRGGEIDLEVWRGSQGTGVDMKAKPNPDSRILSSVWRTLSENKEESEGFVVDDRWPDWEQPIKKTTSSR